MITANHFAASSAHKQAHQFNVHPNISPQSDHAKALFSNKNIASKQVPRLNAKTKMSAFMMPIIKPMMVLMVVGSSVSVHAAILNNDTERRIEIRPSANGNNVYIKPSVTSYGSNNNTASSAIGGDSMQGLIAQKQREFELDARLSIEENKRVNINTASPNSDNHYHTTYHSDDDYGQGRVVDFNAWLNSDRYRAQQVVSYQRYLGTQVGAKNVPPLDQLLTTARSWEKCGYEPYQLPPQELWSNIVPTLRLYSQLKSQGILPANTEIRSVYRSPALNDCAGGAESSKHMTAGAMDIWVPDYEDNPWRLGQLQDGLCQFWQYQGASHNFGLGLYATGAIHLDTQGYRKWGFNHAVNSSACQY